MILAGRGKEEERAVGETAGIQTSAPSPRPSAGLARLPPPASWTPEAIAWP